MKCKIFILTCLFSTLASAAVDPTATLHYSCNEGDDVQDGKGFEIKIKKVTRSAKAYYSILSVDWYTSESEGSLYNFSKTEYLANIGSIGATSYSGRTVYILNFDHMSETAGAKFKSLVSGYDIETLEAWSGVYSCHKN